MKNSYPVLTTDAYILHTHGIGEADRIITALTRERGVLRIRARSIRREGAKMRGAAIPYNRVRLSVVRGRTYILKDITVTDTLASVWSDPRMYTAYVNLLRHIHTLVPAIGEGDRRLFSVTETAVRFMRESDVRLAGHILLTAQVLILDTLGYVSDSAVTNGTFADILRSVSADTAAEKRMRQHLTQALYHQ